MMAFSFLSGLFVSLAGKKYVMQAMLLGKAVTSREKKLLKTNNNNKTNIITRERKTQNGVWWW